MSGRANTEGFERRLWEELSLLLDDAVPPNATPPEAEDAEVRALNIPLTETSDLYKPG